MKLYHFTARHHLDGGPGHPGPGILRVGLLANHHPLVRLPAHVWLTSDPSWEQVWSTRPVPLPDGSTCDRTEVRLTVDIPFGEAVRFDTATGLWRYAAIRDRVRDDWRDDFEGGHDLSAWAVWLGYIRPERITAVEARPTSVPA